MGIDLTVLDGRGGGRLNAARYMITKKASESRSVSSRTGSARSDRTYLVIIREPHLNSESLTCQTELNRGRRWTRQDCKLENYREWTLDDDGD